MIRPFTCLAVLLAAGSGLYLYTEKHRTTLLDERIDKVVSDTGLIRARTSMLEAEWALLNQPDRLGALAGRFLPMLQPIAPGQFVQVADLDKRLPPIGPSPPAAPAPDAVATPPAAELPTAPLLLSSAASPLSASDRTSEAEHAAAPRPAVRAAAVIVHHASRPRRPLSLVASATRPDATEAAPVGRLVAYARPAPILASAWSRPADASRSTPFTGSALGLAHDTMAPPMAAPAR